MDSLTHIVLGAVIGEACLGKKIGKRAMLLGALAQSYPDIDVVESFWLPMANNLVAHRGITHSIIFGLLSAAALGYVALRLHKNHDVTYRQWGLFFALEIMTHLFLDSFNGYGTGLFEPFSHARISFNTLFVADPLFTIWPLVASIALVILSTKARSRKLWTRIGIGMSAAFLLYAIINKSIINGSVKENLAEQHIRYTRFFSTPTALNSWLWYIVAEDKDGYHVGYRSVFDKTDSISFEYFPRRAGLLNNVVNDDLQYLLRFSQGYYTVENQHDTLVFNDLRFGQIMGWTNAKAPFVFHFYLEQPADNLLVIQRGRFAGWNKESFNSLVKRIEGK